MEFASKAQTLINLRNQMSNAVILPLNVIVYREWILSKHEVIKNVQDYFPNQKLIIRSNSKNEDSEQTSNAGAFKSVLGIDSADDLMLTKAIDEVFASYGTNANDDECFCQPLLERIKVSGVIFTADINTNAPYYIINYSYTNSTAITAGEENGKTFVVYKSGMQFVDNSEMKRIISVIIELEYICDCKFLDVEFAIDEEDNVYIFQVRPIVRKTNKVISSSELETSLEKLYKKVEKLIRPHPFLEGSTTCFGVMPDWNPAEILGIRPKKLAISLYKELITDNIWAHQRDDYGYQDCTMHPLMVSFCGIPYIDVRVSFNSFIPKGLTRELTQKLANYYINKFQNHLKLHDKVEFEIVFSCYYFGLPKKLLELRENGFTDNEIKRIEFSLLNLTNGIIKSDDSVFYKDIEKVKELIDRYKTVVNDEISDVDKIYWLIENCKKFGTLPFAGVARAGFIAVQFLRSFVDQGIFTQTEYNSYMNSLHTISKDISTDTFKLTKGRLPKKDFLEKYGHIRPNTYEITSPRYDEAFDLYFGDLTNIRDTKPEVSFQFSDKHKKEIQYELEQNGLIIDADALICFIKEAIEAREYVKFVFTRSVSEILKIIKRLGNRMGIDTSDLAHLDISVIKSLYSDLYYDNSSKLLYQNISLNKRQYEVAAILKLPNVIRYPEDVYSFYFMEDEPNFITQKFIQAEAVNEDNLSSLNLQDKVVFIESADPGYDFLFAKGIAGLITQFGGVNSHMAIRCAENGIPAVIGAGEQKYSKWKQFKKIAIDCLNHRVTELL